MADRIEVANMALGELGTSTISSWTEDSRAARAVRRTWDQARRYCLAVATWRFSARTQELALVVGTPDPGYSYIYQLPADYLRPIAFRDVNGEIIDDVRWAQFGDKLHTSTSGFYLEFVRDVTNVELWPPEFVELVKVYLKGKLSGPLTNRPVSDAELTASLEPTLAFATSLSSLLDQPEEPTPTLWERARWG